jgi:hypothetical protein
MRKKDTLNVFWFRRPCPGNFGDILTPLILAHYGYQVNHAMQEQADYMSIGSIAKLARKGITVLGSGAMTSGVKLDPEANWRWVRGPRTRDLVIRNGGQCPEIYGDPAMLLPRIVAPATEKKHSVGIVPHYIDYEDVKAQYPDLPVINILNSDPTEVVREITSCEKIISSSLHGIVAAHAYGIPAAWVEFSDRLSGDGTKFHDHYESLGLGAVVSTVVSPVFTSAKFDDSALHQILATGDF